VDVNDEVVRGALVLLNGEIMWPPPKREAPPAPAAPAAKPSTAAAVKGREARAQARSGAGTAIALVLAAAAFVGLGLVAPPSFLTHLTVFALACIVGWQVVWNVTPALHTPLMSVTNAISGIIVIGGMLQVSGPVSNPAVLLGAAAILLATINIAGGFLVTQRMLKMFIRR
jgi:NAD(P) transhydrogenase subunit alpha